jgi:eukaryotic-like serine/threonine-protein kinase
MTLESPPQIKSIFDAAFDLAPTDRAYFLDESCNGDAVVRAEVEKLLHLHDNATEFLEAPPLINELPDSSPAINSDAALGRRIGAYKVIRELGRGGMGAVFLAHRADQTFEKQVAIKLVWPGLGSEEIIQRFQQERQILARLEHPNIAHLLDGGVTEDGWHYIVMEYIEGVSITQFCGSNLLSMEARLHLFRAVCEAVQFAHQNLVIHRDLKPGNILVTADSTPKLLDFGIAKLLEQNEASLALTHTQLPLTPEYASPEQLNNQPITTATDVYSLGVVLYEILTRRKPYHFKSPLLHEVARVVTDVEPDKPNLNDDLENIVLKAMRKETAHRYSSVELLNADIGRYLAGKTVLARKATTSYRVGKFVQRYKAIVLLAALLFLTLVTVAMVSIRQNIVAREQAREQRRQLYAAQFSQAMQDWDAGNLPRLRELLSRWNPPAGEEDLRGFEWDYLRQLLSGEVWAMEFPGVMRAMALSPDGKLLATGMADGSVILSDVETGRQRSSFGSHPQGIRCLAFSADGKLIVTGNNAGVVRLWQVQEQTELFTIHAHNNEMIFKIAFAPDGQTFATVSSDKTARLWETATGKEIRTFTGHQDWVRTLCFFKDGRTLLTGSNDGTVRRWEVTTGRTTATLGGYGDEILSLALTPDEKYLAVGGLELELQLFDLTARKIIRTFAGHTDAAWTIALSPDGKLLAGTGPDRTARVWETATGRAVALIKAHDYEMSLLAFTPDGRRLLTGDHKTLKLWDVEKLQQTQALSTPEQCNIAKIAFSSDGQFLAVGEGRNGARCYPFPYLSVWDVATGQAKFVVKELGSFSGLAFVPQTSLLAVGKMNGLAGVWDAVSGQRKAEFSGHAGPFPGDPSRSIAEIHALDVSPGGKLIATGDVRKTVKLWTPAGQEVRTIQGPGEPYTGGVQKVLAAAFSHHGRLLAVGGMDQAVDIFDPITGQKLRTLSPHPMAIHSVKFSPNDRVLATAGEDHLVRLWDVTNGRLLQTLQGHADVIYEIAWTPDGTRIASASKDKTIRLWSVATGLEVMTLRELDQVRAIAFSPDGKILASGSLDGTVRLRRAAARQ